MTMIISVVLRVMMTFSDVSVRAFSDFVLPGQFSSTPQLLASNPVLFAVLSRELHPTTQAQLCAEASAVILLWWPEAALKFKMHMCGCSRALCVARLHSIIW